jgi:hypothetical protein
MPSEQPRMPAETFESMLRGGQSIGLGLYGSEVALFHKRGKLLPMRTKFAILFAITSVIIAFIVVKSR